MSVDSIEQHKKALISFYKKHKRMPGYNEMLALFGFKSKNAVYKVITKLVEAGVVRKDKLGKLLPNLIEGEIPLLGYVEAGLPSPAEEMSLDMITFDDLLLGQREHMYLLRVKGDSMIDAGIYEGDLLLVERTERAKVGDIVVATLDGDWTVKYLREKRGRRYLEPANVAYPDLYPETSLEIGGVVRSVIRTYAS